MSKTFDQGRDEVARLCSLFETNRAQFLAPTFKEAHVRQNLIDPLFEALGWDVRNADHVAPQYREVVPEDSLDIEGHQKAPDYAFRVGTLAKFYAEAKKCGININADPGPAYQLRRYGWSAKVPLSLLTDFEELGVYDCTLRPRQSDKASRARILYFEYQEYPDRWRDIWDVFSREAVWSGKLDEFAASKRKRGTSEVDAEFLKEIEGWRDELARNLALRNLDLSPEDLNEAVQRTIDRIVFLRMAEDRGIESYGQLLKLSASPNIYARFMSDLCRKADLKYNSGLFHFQKESAVSELPDLVTPKLTVDDKVLKKILQGLYFENGCPYHFGVLPVAILGTVYERFLGKVIRLTAGHRAKVEEKPEVRKAGGVYYTPAYIVDYIVKQTVGKQIEGRSPAQLAGAREKPCFRVLDMACGSGSFLLGAYQYLLDHGLKWYVENKPETHKKAVRQDPRDQQWRLTIEEKKRILIAHLFGVDIDRQAVEVTKLSLMLKALEGEDDISLTRNLELFQSRALPNLAENILCGNSLIGPDYFLGTMSFDPEEMKRVNPFDWNAAFPQAMQAGGFDCVIGNPPYGAEFRETNYDYLKHNFETFVWRGESYLLFVEKAINSLKNGGYFGYIIPDTYLNLSFTQSLRAFLLQNTKLREIVLLPSSVFAAATVDTTLVFAEKTNKIETFNDTTVSVRVFNKKSPIAAIGEADREFCVATKFWHMQKVFNLQTDSMEIEILASIERERKLLSDLAEVFYGIKVYQVGKGKPPQTKEIRDTKPFTSEKRENISFSPFFDGKHIARYQLLWGQNNWVNYGPWLAEPRKPEKYEGEKILIRKIVGKTLIATYVPETSYCNTLLFALKLKHDVDISYRYFLGILNSHLIGWYIIKKLQICPEDTFPQIMIRDVLQIPVPAADQVQHDRMVLLVDSMLALHKQLAVAESVARKEMIQRQINATDAEIDRLVYDLYGLTPDEIAIVEGKS